MDHQEFSKVAKVQLMNYLSGNSYHLNQLENFIGKIQNFDLDDLTTDSEKLAFWINVYNGMINYQIVKNALVKTVWEKPDFFTKQILCVGGFSFSLDDIEHGILRKNGDRKNGKPKQFNSSDDRLKLMVDKMDFRIHFALNCGSVSCPSIAYYSVSEIDRELRIAEDAFSSSEFLVNHETKRVDCSSIFTWYRNDFGQAYLNSPELSQYIINERPYIWEIQ